MSSENPIQEAIESLQNNQALIVMDDPVVPDRIAAMHITMEQLKEFTEAPDSIFVVGLTIRPGMSYFLRHLELVHLHPEQMRNNEFIMVYLKWYDMPFVIASVPSEFREAVKDSARVTQMTLVEGALPMTVTEQGFEPLPISYKNVYSVESARFSVLHKLGTQQALEWEAEEIQKLEQKYL